MSEQDGQLAADYRDVQQRFSASPHIQVRAVHGDPPESYEIDYFLKGLHKKEDGSIVPADAHTVRIELPYGYPMFSPDCNPISPIFHPDFHPGDISTGDFWEKTPSLPDLIIHIGRLIAFQLYSDEDVHNQEALVWAFNHGDQLPLDTIDFSPLATYAMPKEQKHKLTRKEEDDTPHGIGSAPEESFITKMDEPIDNLLDYNLPTAHSPVLSQGTRFVIITLITVGLVAAVGGFYMRSLWHYDGALQQWITMGPLLEQGKFKEADQQLETILARLDKVRLVNKAEKLHLLKQINEVRSSEKFRQGLLGKVLFNEHYYSKQELESFHDINNRLAKGEAFGSVGRWPEAVEEYENASQQTILLGERAPVSDEMVRKTLHHARLQEEITVGDLLKAEKDWTKAETHLKTTLRLVTEIENDLDPVKAKELENSLRSKLAEIDEYKREEAISGAISRGDQFLSQKKWPQAVANYENALRIAERWDNKFAQRAEKLKPHLDIARLHIMYEEGVNKLKAGNWNEAIEKLELSETLRNKVLASGKDVSISEKMIKRKILSARIKREEATVSGYLKKKKYIQANEALEEIVSLVDQSGLATDREFVVAKSAATNRIKENIFMVEVEKQKEYLAINYKDIFIKYFPSSAYSDFSDLKISLAQRDDSFLYFFMQCKAKRNRLQSILELDYKFDRKTGDWSIH